MSTPLDADRPDAFDPEPETTSQPLTQEEGNGGENAVESVGTTESEPKEQRSFGGLTPQEAGRRSAQRRREQALATERAVIEQSSGKVEIVRTPVEIGHIMSRLQADAKKGNTQAARELREWMSRYPAEDATDISALDARTQQEVLARVLADIAEDEGQAPLEPLGS